LYIFLMLSFHPVHLSEHRGKVFDFCFSYGIGGKAAVHGLGFWRQKRRIGKVVFMPAWFSVLFSSLFFVPFFQ
jgi:hypothetical protein